VEITASDLMQKHVRSARHVQRCVAVVCRWAIWKHLNLVRTANQLSAIKVLLFKKCVVKVLGEFVNY